MKKTYIIEYTWGEDNPIHEEMEITTDDINWSLGQIARNRGNIKFTSVKEKE
tara:strand:+ start:200 stop:355 length:156 start_codon:yes stop_codon:yes gene_type:complete